ncbi:hypothetical protein COL11_17590 [Bacillus anthracis]|nr:hypothetical protein AT267_12195 [Bacillus cereus]PED54957.1 hypothetical protein CON50_13465 [Bacillus anthracis]PEF46275.1 hypothetical protein CON22_14015 [Bacillus cereus]PEU80006.1 hypothetical protein CN394_16245 [Bacillus anthracis]PEZ21522.1 hypothetical protein CN337_16435 [Bacillus anthracis]
MIIPPLFAIFFSFLVNCSISYIKQNFQKKFKKSSINVQKVLINILEKLKGEIVLKRRNNTVRTIKNQAYFKMK